MNEYEPPGLREIVESTRFLMPGWNVSLKDWTDEDGSGAPTAKTRISPGTSAIWRTREWMLGVASSLGPPTVPA